MIEAPQTLTRRQPGEWELTSKRHYANPFLDVAIEGQFTSPSGATSTIPGFFDGEGRWRVRFNPGEEGHWTFKTGSVPHDPDLVAEGRLEVRASDARGFLKATPGDAWGFTYENGEPAFLLGDTVYNLFGMAYCGGDVDGFLQRRADQGFNLLRIRVPVSPFHPPEGYSDWQDRRIPAWGGSETAPRFDQFNLDYFRTVDQVVRRCEELGIGIEMIMEGWGFEFPFNHRAWFTSEWEEHWLRFLIARYDAFNCVYFWTPLNEYEYYPNGDWNYTKTADRWALHISRWIKSVACHGHIVAMHNGPRLPPFAERFKADPEAVDAIMFQEWGTRDKELGWLAAGIEESIERAFEGWGGSAVFAEWGYERNPELKAKLPSHDYCDRGHTRRGAWRGAFCGYGIIHGFENSWGPWMVLDSDQEGMADLLQLRRFFTEIAPFAELKPAEDLLSGADYPAGHKPSCLATSDRRIVAVYLPTGGEVALDVDPGGYSTSWFDPRTGELSPAEPSGRGFAIDRSDDPNRPDDWVLLLERR